MLRHLSYLILALLLNHFLFSQTVASRSLSENILFHRITTEQGLPSDIIHCTYQDEKGFLWIGTSNGLCRFDGSRMTLYQNDPKDSFSISDNDVLSITSHNGKLAIGTFGGGLNILDYSTNKFSNYRNQKNNPVFADNGIYTIASIDASHLVTASGFLRILDIKNRKVELIKMPANTWTDKFDSHVADQFSPYRIFIDHEKKWWLAGEAGIVIYDPATKKSNLFCLRKDAIKGLKDFSNYSCREDNEGNIWIGGGSGLFEYNRAADKLIQHYPDRFSPTDSKSRWVKTVLIKDDNSIWFGTENGLFHYFPRSGSYNIYNNDPNESGSISDNNISYLFEDKQHIIWIGTENGLNTLYPTTSPFKVYQNLPGDNNSIQSNITKASFKDEDGNIWIGTNKGLECIEAATGIATHFDLPAWTKNLPENTVMPILQNDHSSIWIGTWGKGLYLFDFKKRKIAASYKFTSNGPESICSNHIHSLCKDSKGNLWIATWNGGIDKFDPVKKTFEHFNTTNKNSGVNSDYLTKVTFAFNTIWTGSGSGLLRYDESANKFNFYRTTNDTNNIYATSVNDIVPFDDINLLLASAYGLTRFNTVNGHFEKIDPGAGFIMAMHKQTNDSIWLATSLGLKLYIPSRNETVVYSLKDGLPISYFPVECFFHQAKNGEIFLSSNNGLIHFFPNQIKRNESKSPLYITSIKIGNNDLKDYGDPSLLSALKLKHDENYLTINFATLNFFNPSQNQYAYKLENIDKDWVYAGNRNEVIYPSLPPGNYTFKVKASNDAGVWNEKEISLNIHIASPWWKTWWFYSICFITIFVGIYSLYRLRINRILAEQKLRNKIARDLHDDIGSTLSGIKLFSTMAQNKLQQERSSAVDIVERIGERSEKMMEAMGDIVWSINPANDSMEKMLVRMKQYAAEMMEPKNINYNFSVNERSMRTKVDPEARKDIYLVFKETINNAVKHSQCNYVDIKIDWKGKNFEITIHDNGKGFDVNKVNGNGNGLLNLKQRTKDIGGEISIDSTETGTTVKLIVPVT